LRRVLRERLGATAGFVALALILPSSARSQAELFHELKTVQAVHLNGVDNLSGGAVRRVLKTRVPPWYRPWGEKSSLRLDFLRADTLAIRAVYRHDGFLDARSAFRILPGKNEDQVIVEFDVVEGPRSIIRTVQLEKVRPDLEDQIRGKLWARDDRPFDPGYMQLDSVVIAAVYQDHGFRPNVSGIARKGAANDIHISYRIEEGPRFRVGEIFAHGYQPVKSKLVMRELVLKPGDVDRRDRLIRSQERLYETGLFSQVYFTAIPDTDGTTMDYDVRVKARPPRWLEVGVGSSSSEKAKLNGSWGMKNLLGRGIQMAVAGQVAMGQRLDEFKRGRIDVGVLEPWLFGVRLRGEAGPFLEWVDDRTQPSYVLHQDFTGINFNLRRDINRTTTLRLSQKNVFARQHLSFDDLPAAGDSAANAGRDSAIAARNQIRLDTAPSYRTHSVLLVFERDLRDNFLLTRRGNVTVAAFEVAGGALKGTSSFYKGDITQSWFKPFGRTVLAARVRGGAIAPFGETSAPVVGADDPVVAQVPLPDRFRTGGVNSIRGYDENEIPAPPANGGLAIIQANLEWRVPLIRLPVVGQLGLETFIDMGNVWPRPRYIRWEQFRPSISRDPYGDHDVRYVFGIGPRFELPIGPLRIDVSWSARPTTGVRGYLEPRVRFAIGPSI